MTHTSHWRRFAPRAAAGILLAACALAAAFGTSARAEDRPIIGIADFYSIQPEPVLLLLDPEQYSADVSAGVLIRAGGSAITVLPRGEVRDAERKLNWHTRDALNFTRLQVLGQAIQADRLIVGWITRMVIYRQDFALFSSDASINTQVFDTRQGRIVWQQETTGSGQAGSPDFALQIALDRAVAGGMAAAVPALSAPVDRAPASLGRNSRPTQ